MKTILDRLAQALPSLPSRRRKACQFIMEHPLEAGNMTLSELAKEAGVGAATVLRLVSDLGFENFQLFKRELRNSVVQSQQAGYGTYLRNQQLASRGNYANERLAAVVLLDNLSELADSMKNPDTLASIEHAVQLLIGAQRIFVLGLRTASAIAECFENVIGRLTGNVIQLSNQQEFVFDRVSSMVPGDVLFVISSWPCTKRTIDISKLASQLGIPIILLTNLSNHVLAERSEVVINTGAVNSPFNLLPGILIVDMIAYEISHRTMPQTEQRLKRIEKLLAQNDLQIWEYGSRSE